MRTLPTLVLAILCAAPVRADDLRGRFAAGGAVGGGVPVGSAWVSQHATIGPVVGGFLRYGIDKRLGLGFSYDNLGFGKGGIRVQPVLFNVYYSLKPDSPLNPNIHLGLGGMDMKRNETGRQTTFANKFGVGIDYFVHRNVAVGGFGDYLLGWYKSGASQSPNHEIDAFLFGATVSLWFGPASGGAAACAAPPAPAAAPAAEAAPVVAAAPVVEAAPAPAPAPEIPAAAPILAAAPIVVSPAPSEKAAVELLIGFDAGQSVIKPEYDEKMRQVAEFLKANPEAQVEIAGHTDGRESPALAQHRADTVRWRLVSRYGAPAGRIKAKGYGSTMPIAGNKTAPGRAQNRRVIAIFTGQR
ncbi:MAG: OmpA family protein [Elusimicrobia bacterium]|nr:OmpA family protein [Elusimicrobiota bacterium]